MRINQYLARAGVCSRRGADKVIEDRRVTVNGQLAVLGMDIQELDVVCVDGKQVSLPDSSIVLAYYKPIGVTCSEKDEHAERLVVNEVKSDRRLTYAGRLDRDSEGLLIMTDDGELINAMMKGANKHEKEYIVTVNRAIKPEMLQKMASGIYIEELDTTTRPCEIEQIDNKSFKIILTQGLNRQIRRMCDAVGLKVVKLKRTRVMNVELKNLQVGASRDIVGEEKKLLYLGCGLHM